MRPRTTQRLVWRQLHWQRPLDPERCLALLRQLASDERSPRVVLEAHATTDGVTYLLGTSPATMLSLTAAVTSLLPGTTLTTAETRAPVTTARHLKASTRHRALRAAEPSATARHLLTALAAVQDDERLVLQLVLGSRRVPLAVPTKSPSSVVAPWWYVLWHGNGGTIDSEKRTALRDKVGDHGFACAMRIGVNAASSPRRRSLVLGVVSALRTSEAAGLQLRHAAILPTRISDVSVPTLLPWPLRLNVSEVLALTAWPLGDADLPGQPALHPRLLPPVADTTERGRIVATSTAPGSDALLRLSAQDALHHTHVLGPTGVGKSVLLGRLIEQDIAAGRAVVVIEPKGDLVDDVLAHVPAERHGDVVIVDPADRTPVGLNPLTSRVQPDEVVADGILSVFKTLYAQTWGPRTQDILHAALLTLSRHQGASLVMLPLLLTNPGFRRSLTSRLRDPLALQPFWLWYENLSDAERQAVIAPVMNKLRPWLLNPSLRAVLGQREPRFHISGVFTRRRILLVPLRSGVIGQEAARLLGSLVVAQLWQTIQARSAIPAERRQPVMVYIDEVQDYLHLPTDLGDALAQARGLGVGFTLAHQFLGQLSPEMRAGVLANARSRICFQLSHDDALTMSKGHPELSPDDFTALGSYAVYASLFADGQVNPYASGRTLPPGPAIADPQLLRQISRERYGRSLDDIEAGFAELLDAPVHADAMPGRRRRTP